MKLDNHTPDLDKSQKIETKLQKQQEIELRKIGDITLHPNHKLYELTKSGTIKEAEYIYDSAQDITWMEALNKDYTKLTKRVKINHTSLYCSAMNVTNARKRFNGMIENGEVIKGKYINPEPMKL